MQNNFNFLMGIVIIFLTTSCSYMGYGEREYDLSYGEHPRQKIDFYKGTGDYSLIWIHGGGWLEGDKRSTRSKLFFKSFPEEYNIFSINYRIGEDTAPDAADDVMCAYKFIEEKIALEGLSPEKVYVMGASAGGHLALVIGLLNTSERTHQCRSSYTPLSIINIFGITEINKTEQFLTDSGEEWNYVKIWVPEDKFQEISDQYSPLYMITKNAPPIITIHGTEDIYVAYEQALMLHDKLVTENKLVTIEGKGHGDFSDDEWDHVRSSVISFMKKNSQP